MSDLARCRRVHSSGLIASVLAALLLGGASTARAEPSDGFGSVRGDPESDVGSLFQAQRQLESMGIRNVVRLQLSRGATGVPGEREPGSAFDTYRGRVTAPTLAFLHGLCDGTGGLPRYGEAITLRLLPSGMIEFRASALGQLIEVDDRSSRFWIWDAGRLGDRVVVRRVSEPRTR